MLLDSDMDSLMGTELFLKLENVKVADLELAYHMIRQRQNKYEGPNHCSEDILAGTHVAEIHISVANLNINLIKC